MRERSIVIANFEFIDRFVGYNTIMDLFDHALVDYQAMFDGALISAVEEMEVEILKVEIQVMQPLITHESVPIKVTTNFSLVGEDAVESTGLIYDKNGLLCARSVTRYGFFDKNGRPQRIPRGLVEFLQG